MGDHKERDPVTRRDILKLAGTAAAFCTSFGFLHAGQKTAEVQDKHVNWDQAEIKWFSGSTILYSSAIPAKVAKHLESDVNATVEVKLFQSGKLLKNLGTIQGKH